MTKSLFFSLSLLLALSMILISCAGPAVTTTNAPPVGSTAKPGAPPPTSAKTTTTPASTSAQPQYGGILKIILDPVTETVTNLGYPAEKDQPGDQKAKSPAVENLVCKDPNYNIVPQLASSFEFNSNYSTLTFKLRQGIKFQDDVEFDADAVKYVLEESRKSSSMGPMFAPCASIDVLDKYTVRLNAKTVFDPAFLINLEDHNGYMVSPKALQTRTKEQNLYYPVGTGPYKVVDFQRDISMKFVRNDKYWGSKPYLDEIDYIFIADSMTRIASFKAGEAQVLGNLTGNDLYDMKNAGYNFNLSWGGAIGVGFDSKDPNSPFSKLPVRQAVAYAINMEAANKSIAFGTWEVCTQIYPSASPAYNKSVVGYPFNPQKAKDLLAQAGYSGGINTQLTAPNMGTRKDLYTLVQSFLKDVGINVTLNLTDRGTVTNLWTKGWVGMLDVPFVGSQPSGEMGQPIIATLMSGGSYGPVIDFPADYDAKAKAAVQILDPAKRTAAFQELSKMIIDQYCIVVPEYAQSSGTVFNSKVHTDAGKNMWWFPGTNWIEK
jgi:peptide/nickel transport system substrate-binding protein